MADINISQGQSVPQDMHTKYEDMGDGTHALVVSVGGTIPVSGGLTDAELRAASVDVDVTTVTLPTTLLNGVVTVTTATTRVPLIGASTPLISGVTVKAAADNTGIIYVGNATVAAANGFRLAAGESVFLEIANLQTVNVDASIDAQSVTYIAS